MNEKRVIIEDFVEDLNYSNIAFEIDKDIYMSELYEKLKKDYCNHLYNLGRAHHGVYVIENCDLYYYNWVSTYFDEGYKLVHLEYDKENKYFFYTVYEE